MSIAFAVDAEALQAIMASVAPLRELREMSGRQECSYAISERAVTESDFGIVTEVSLDEG